MTKEKALLIQELINNKNGNQYEATSVIASIRELDENDFRVDVKPDRFNVGDTFYHIESIADIARAYDVDTYAVIEDDTIHVKLF